MENHFDGQYIDPVIQEPLRAAMQNEDPLWLTTGKPRIVDEASDRGGLTCGGITATRWGQYRNLGRSATREELAAITFDQAVRFYYVDYVLAPKFDRLADQKLRALCIDWSFTSGPDDPWRAVQISLAARGLYKGALDGIPGPVTRAAIVHDNNQRQTYRDVFAARIKFYVRLAFGEAVTREFIKAHPSVQLRNLAGWLNRSLEFQL